LVADDITKPKLMLEGITFTVDRGKRGLFGDKGLSANFITFAGTVGPTIGSQSAMVGLGGQLRQCFGKFPAMLDLWGGAFGQFDGLHPLTNPGLALGLGVSISLGG